jgi:hypothetical protein
MELELNEKLKKYENLNLISNIAIVNNKRKFILSIYDSDIVLYRTEYIILGTYSTEKNLWIWSNMSTTIDKKMAEYVTHFKDTIISTINEEKTQNNEKYTFMDFMRSMFIVIPCLIFHEYLCNIEKQSKKYKIICHGNSAIHVFGVKNTLFDNIQ